MQKITNTTTTTTTTTTQTKYTISIRHYKLYNKKNNKLTEFNNEIIA